MREILTVFCFERKAGENMTERQKRFADEYLIDCNAEQAAIRAGYSEKYARGNAHKLVANGGIKEYLEEKLEEVSSSKIASAEEVIEYLTSVLRSESLGSELSNGEIILKPPSEKDKLKAAELLGKRYGIYTDKINLSVEPITIINDLKE